MMSYQVRFWAIKTVKNRRRPYGVRWVVEGEEKSEWFTTRNLADNFRSELMQAARRGEAFDTVTGLPESKMRRQESGTWYEHACAYVKARWKASAANTRVTVADCLAPSTRVLVVGSRGAPKPEMLHRALAKWAFCPGRLESETPPDEIAAALAWLERNSLPMAEVAHSEVLRSVLDSIASNLDGSTAKATTINRRRSVLHACLDYAIERKIFTRNPLDDVRWEAPKRVEVVDPRRVPNPDTARALMAAIPAVAPKVGRHLRAFYACLYFGALRPSEALDLRLADCTLPATGWGKLTLAGSAPAAGRKWTDSGKLHDDRGLKHRAEGATRTVPIPPELVTILRTHVAEFGVAEDGRLFRSQRGNRLAPVSYEDPWTRARERVLSPAQVASPLAGTPYDLRHACVSLWLNGGVPAPDVAERAGHSVKMLLSTYAHCIDGGEDEINKRIDAALGSPSARPTEHAERMTPRPAPSRTRVPRPFRDYRRTADDRGAHSRMPREPQNGEPAGSAGIGQVGENPVAGDVDCLHSGM